MRTSTRIRRLAAIGTIAAAMSLAGAAPALAADSAVALAGAAPALADPSGGPGAGPNPTGTGERAKKLCGRLPQLLARIDKALARLQGGADTPGSVEFVKKRAEKARANGNTALATALDSRAKARADMIPVLQKRKAEGLPKLTDWCTSHGYGTGE